MPKKQDFVFWGLLVLLFLPFFLSREVYQAYLSFNHDHGLVMAFVKFAVLATLGELIGQHIKTGKYLNPGFGILPRMLVWGFIGVTIKMAFIIFSTGVPVFLEYLGLDGASAVFHGPLSWEKLLIAFCTSATMNLIYAPVMMTFHKITDTHILETHGTLRGFFTPIPFRRIFVNLDWNVMWNFVFKITIPLFWIPAHTVTFLLPPDWQVLFAALLGIALGTILAAAGKKKVRK